MFSTTYHITYIEINIPRTRNTFYFYYYCQHSLFYFWIKSVTFEMYVSLTILVRMNKKLDGLQENDWWLVTKASWFFTSHAGILNCILKFRSRLGKVECCIFYCSPKCNHSINKVRCKGNMYFGYVQMKLQLKYKNFVDSN